MYLELRSRIPVVAENTRIGAARLEEAQKATGLSNERIARLIPVSERTWRRWKEKGEIPTAVLPAAARALRLDLHELNPDAESDDAPNGRIDALRAELEEVQHSLEDLPAIREQLSRIEALLLGREAPARRRRA